MKFDLICRVCLKEGEMKSIFDSYKIEKDRPVYCSEMLNVCTATKVSPSDGFPTQICRHCFAKLWSAYKLRRLCETSYEYLANYILENKHSVENIKTEANDDCPLIDFVTGAIENVDDKKESFIKLEALQDNDDKEDLDLQDTYVVDQFDGDDANDDFYNETNNYDEQTENENNKEKRKRNLKNESYIKDKSVKRIACLRCPKKFRNQLSYLKHEDKHLLSDNPELEKRKSFACPHCPVKFNFKEILSKHERCHVVRKKHNAIRKEMPCTHCSKTFKNKLCLMKHIDKHLGIQTSTEETLACTYCSKILKDRTLLMKHEASHLGLKTYYCETCKKSYRSEVDHKAYCGLGLSFKCDECSKCFKTKSRLISHIGTHNTNRKKYICDYEGCGKIFLSAPGISKHKKLHTGVKIMCHLCSKEFTDKYLLEMHVNRHNNERKYPCSYCEKRFFSSGAKLEHERRHTNTRNFACSQCDKRFVSSTNLKRHMLWHEKKFDEQCRFCEKRFLVRGNRKTHEAIMHGVTKTVDESKYFCQQRMKATRLPKVCVDT